MTLINLAFTVPLLSIGAVVSYIDVKKGTIPNKYILAGLSWGAALYSFLFFYHVLFLNSTDVFNYLPPAVLNGIIAVSVGYLIWRLGFWSAGDGKLFGLYGLLLPLEYYSDFYIEYFPAFALLANLAIPLLLLLAGKALMSAFKKRGKILKKLKEREFLKPHNLRRYGRTVFIFVTDITMAMIVIRFLVSVFERVLLMPPNGFVIFILLVVLMYGFRKLKLRFPILEFIKYFLIILFFGNFLVQFDFQSIFNFARMIAVFAIFIGLLRSILLFYVNSEETEEIKANEVEEGMVLTKEWKTYFSQKISQLKKNDKHKHFDNLKGGGLTKKQAEIIRELFASDDNYRVKICNTLPFAPFMLLAAGISVLTHSSFVPVLIDFFNMFAHF